MIKLTELTPYDELVSIIEGIKQVFNYEHYIHVLIIERVTKMSTISTPILQVSEV